MPPGQAELAQILASVGKPVNALAAGPIRNLTVPQLAAMGVRRISLGSQIARLTHAAIQSSVSAMLDEGSFAPLLNAASGPTIDALLVKGAPKGTPA